MRLVVHWDHPLTLTSMYPTNMNVTERFREHMAADERVKVLVGIHHIQNVVPVNASVVAT